MGHVPQEGEETPHLLAGVANFRDVGGLSTADGRVLRRGVVYRSELLSRLTLADRETLEQLRIGAVFDLRNPSERSAAPPAWPRVDDPVAVAVMPMELEVAGADVRGLMDRLRGGNLDAEEARAILVATYASMPHHFAAMLGRLFLVLGDQERGAALVHCTAGKDRTGFIVAMLLHALRIPADDIWRDYLSSAHHYTAKRLHGQMEKIADGALDPRVAAALKVLAEVQEEYLGAALGRITRDWGTVDNYLSQAAGLDDALRARIQARLLQPA